MANSSFSEHPQSLVCTIEYAKSFLPIHMFGSTLLKMLQQVAKQNMTKPKIATVNVNFLFFRTKNCFSSYAYVLYLEVPFCQKTDSFSVSAIFSDSNTLVFRINGDNCNRFSVHPLGYAHLIYFGGF